MVERLVGAALGIAAVGAGAAAIALRRRRAGERVGDKTAPPAVGPDAEAGPASPQTPAAIVLDDAAPARGDTPQSLASAWGAAWRAPLDDSRTRLEINLAIAESAMRSQRPRNPYFDEAGRQCGMQLIRIIRTGDDEASWAALEPLTTSGEILHLVDFARAYGGVFSAQSLLACAERLWCRRLAHRPATPPAGEPLAAAR